MKSVSLTSNKEIVWFLATFFLLAFALGLPGNVMLSVTPAYAQDDPDDDLDDDIDDDIEQDIEDDVESDIEDDVESEIENDIENDIESEIESDIESDIEDDIESEIESSIEDDIEDDVESDVEDEIESEIENEVEDDAAEDLDDDLREEIEDDTEDFFDDAGSSAAGSGAGAVEILAEELFDVGRDDNNQEIRADERVLLLEPGVLEILNTRGYQTIEQSALEGLGLVLVRIEAPDNLNLEQEVAALKSADPSAEIDFNHLYRPQLTTPAMAQDGYLPSAFAADNSVWERDRLAARKQIGLIDTMIDTEHEALRGSRIKVKDFVTIVGNRPQAHGTAVASILVGQGKVYQGIVPNASLGAASVFVSHPSAGETASTDSLIRAINWMVSNKVQVVNMSLAGPENRVLGVAVTRAAQKGVLFVAAAGNEGPNAAPRYPAAYDQVVAITAVDLRNRVYRLAGRGKHIDFAAPGVDVISADSSGSLSRDSGTSMAAPFASAVVYVHCIQNRCSSARQVVAGLKLKSVDLGRPGFDTTYGYGLIQP